MVRDIVRNGMWEGALGPGATSAATGTLFGGTRDQRIDARRAPSRTEANDSSRRKEPGCDDSEGRGSVPIFAKVGRDDGCGG
jgi:hypothetical protein